MWCTRARRRRTDQSFGMHQPETCFDPAGQAPAQQIPPPGLGGVVLQSSGAPFGSVPSFAKVHPDTPMVQCPPIATQLVPSPMSGGLLPQEAEYTSNTEEAARPSHLDLRGAGI